MKEEVGCLISNYEKKIAGLKEEIGRLREKKVGV
jgi:hypothetical protein